MSLLFFFAGGLGEQSVAPSKNATSTDSKKTVKKGNVVPHPDLWVSFVYYFILCKTKLCPVYRRVTPCLGDQPFPGICIGAFVGVGGLSARVGLPFMVWWVDPSIHT